MDGRYSFGHRPIHQGSYSIDLGVVTITCDYPYTFLGLASERIFFRDKGKLYTIDANIRGTPVELIQTD